MLMLGSTMSGFDGDKETGDKDSNLKLNDTKPL